MKLQKILTVCAVLCTASLFAQTRTVQGTVTYGDAPIHGLKVAVQGSQTSATTDAKGHYSIQLTPKENTLIFTGEGVISQYITLKKKQDMLDVALKISDLDLAISKGIIDKHYSTTATNVIRPGVNEKGSMDIKQIIEGKAPGTVYQDGYLYIRGERCMLYIIDGSRHSNLEMVDPTTISKIEIVKDGTASVYGADGQNGVVLITTTTRK